MLLAIFPIQLTDSKANLSMLARASHVSTCKDFVPIRLKILTPKQMLQGLPIAPAKL